MSMAYCENCRQLYENINYNFNACCSQKCLQELREEKVNLDDLTLGQIKQLQGLVAGQRSAPKMHPDLGKKVIIRTYSAGVHYGTLVSKEGMEVQLENAIRFYYWSGAFTLSQLAMEGVTKPDECKFAMPVDRVTLEAIEILPCTEKAIEIVEGVECKKQ